MTAWTETIIGDELELAYGKSLPAHAREIGPYEVFGSNGRVGYHSVSLRPGPGIIVGRKGSVGEVVYSEGDFWPIDTTYYVVNKGEHDWRFLFYLLSRLGLTKLNSHSAIPGLNREDVYSIGVSLPERSEQRLIGKALDAIQNSLSQEISAIDLVQGIKRAAMRALFTRGLRGEAQKETEIGPVPDSWDVVAFAGIREWLQYGTSTHCSYNQTDFPVLRIPNIEAGCVSGLDIKFAKLRTEEAQRYRLEVGDLIFIRTNGVIERLGTCAVYAGEPEGALFASYLIRARLNLERIDPYFAAYFFGSELGTGIIAGRATPAADGKYNLNTGIIDSLLIPLPPTLDEQREIVAILDAIDSKIDLHKRKRAVLDDLFKALLHKLMTGEIRVADLDLSALDGRAVAEA